ncbi:Protein MAINTENANCE OF MERISTEMS [Camellia lanceoleosa]|uniref:Protein MAINTENANCE OF MERISTEMS n=1 Tax=Camellia lanceoleosa TaxID=1840588 RepID=A0ACC0I6F4_9ERIC|nr:Protein MAINTENANCE OF MERISTEMS [Camellia lanceoleosa]
MCVYIVVGGVMTSSPRTRSRDRNRIYVFPGSPSKKIGPRIQGCILFKQVKPIRIVPAVVEPQKMLLNYRPNIAGIVKIVSTSELTEAHCVHLRRTPFWFMFEAILENDLKSHDFRKCDELVFKLIQTYMPDTGCFHIGNGKLTLRDSDIRLIFGLQCGGQPLLMTPEPRPPSDFIQRRFGSESRISSKLVKTLFCDAVQGTSTRDVEEAVKLMTLYVCVKLFFSTSGESMSWTLIRIIDKLDSMKLYDWTDAIRSALQGSVKEFHRIPGKVTRCVVVLLYFLCERTTLVVVDRPGVFPRFLKWNVGTLLARMRSVTLDDVDKFEVLLGRLQVSEYERDQLLSGNNVVDGSDDDFVDRIDMIDDVKTQLADELPMGRLKRVVETREGRVSFMTNSNGPSVVATLENAHRTIFVLQSENKSKDFVIAKLEEQVSKITSALEQQASNLFVGFNSCLKVKDDEITRMADAKNVEELIHDVTQMAVGQDSVGTRNRTDIGSASEQVLQAEVVLFQWYMSGYGGERK